MEFGRESNDLEANGKPLLVRLNDTLYSDDDEEDDEDGGGSPFKLSNRS
jgi:hypothetical protein